MTVCKDTSRRYAIYMSAYFHLILFSEFFVSVLRTRIISDFFMEITCYIRQYVTSINIISIFFLPGKTTQVP